MKVKTNTWNAIASWNWDLGDNDSCTICMNAFESPCPTCKIPGDDCPPLEGTCGHLFHLHCIYKWLETNDKCPLDRELWSEKTIFVNNNNNQGEGIEANNQNSNMNISMNMNNNTLNNLNSNSMNVSFHN